MRGEPVSSTGHVAVLDQLLADGVTHVFGNPGTVEQGLLDALGDREGLKYILCLQESVAVYAADAYARATGGLGVVQIHSSPGLGNAVGALYQAMRGQSPLLVLGGDAGIRYAPMEAQMAADLVGIARPVTKWAAMVPHPASLLRMLRRAVKVALTPPCGPVYLCLPQDVLDAVAEELAVPVSVPRSRSLPEDADLDAAAAILAEAERPVIYIGDGVARSGAQAALAALAEALGAPVWGVDSGELNLPYDHPMWQGQTGHMFGSHSLPITRSGDANLVVGTYMLPEVFPELGPVFAPGARVVHVDLVAEQIGKNHPVDLGLLADPRRTLEALLPRVMACMPEPRQKAAAARLAAACAARPGAVEKARRLPAGGDAPGTLQFAQVMAELAPRLPRDALVFDEALTNSPALTAWLQPAMPGQFFQTRGGSLGTALAGGLGLQAAAPGRCVLAVSGDGGANYVPQALWSAARHRLPVRFVICNNRSYRLLQANIHQFWEERGVEGRAFPLSFDLSEPPIDYPALARGYGVAAARIETRADIVPAVERMLAHPGPFLLEVLLEGDVAPHLVGVRCGQ